MPWTVPKVDPVTGQVMKDENGKEMWDGYCVDFVKKLSEEMQFDYDLVVPEDRKFGKKLPNGQWDGLIGDLAKGVRILHINLFMQASYSWHLYACNRQNTCV